MPAPVDARHLAESLVGQTIPTPAQGNPNRVIRVRARDVLVATEDSPQGAPVALRQLQRGLDVLFDNGEIRIEPETFGGYRRSSFIGAALAALPAAVVTDPPTYVRLDEANPLRDQLAETCRLVTEDRLTPNVTADDPLHRLMVHTLPGTLRGFVNDPVGFKVQGSAGQVNFPWAETPWVSIFDRLVTESAQRGHYVVYLVHPHGTGVYLSLLQAVTEVRQGRAGGYRDVLIAQATRFRSYLEERAVDDLITEPLDLAGEGYRTRGYEAANIVATFYPADRLPPDAALVLDLRHLLRLYATTTEGLDEEEMAASGDAPHDAKTGKESKRYRWHLRAEGRNRSVVRRAKELRNYSCQVCERGFVAEYGDLGKRCVDAHHLTPFTELDARPRELDPRVDFAVVCSNCHRLLHSETPPLTPDALVAALRTSDRG